jgi:FtsH-binding integral membrane protein
MVDVRRRTGILRRTAEPAVFGDAEDFRVQGKAMYNELDIRLPREERMAEARATFLRRTYAHLAGAILAFVALEAFLLKFVFTDDQAVIGLLGGGHPFGFLLIFGAFIGASMLAQAWARAESSPALQYMGLALYVVAEAIIFVPLLYICQNYSDPTLIPTAGILTLAVFGGLTLSVFVTKKDHSNLAPILSVGSMIALGVIIAAIIFGFSLGLFFSFAMVALLSGYILYQTSMVLLHFRTDQHVAAALMLFSSVATLFWYILRILMELNRRN